MCGIAGSYQSIGRDLVGKMLSAMKHRGPDSDGISEVGSAVIAQARLAIIDTSAAGYQPMFSDDGQISIVYNGEVYNFLEQREVLERRGYEFKSDSDTEVVLKLYQEFGEDFLSRLRGIFAIAIHDNRDEKDTLLLARDQFGIKPLLYTENENGIIFASELKGLLASEQISRQIDHRALQQLLCLGSVYQPRTLIKDVKALPSAHFLRVDHNGMHMERYWSYGLNRVEGLREKSYSEQLTQFTEIMQNSVKRQMISDVPIGAFLSGGVDSSLIVALMAKQSGENVKTFSVGFESSANAIDESHEAAEIAKLLGTDHTRIEVNGDDMLQHLANFVRGLDQPSVDGLNSYFVSYAAAQDLTVSLSGTGGDELFLGYPWFANVERDINLTLSGQSSRFRRLLAKLPFGEKIIAKFTSATIRKNEFCEIFGKQYHCFGPDLAHRLLAPRIRENYVRQSLATEISECDELPESGWLDRSSVMCMNGYTRNQLLRDIDACAMIHSLEVRVPFLDVDVADFAFSLPNESKLSTSEATSDPYASYTESGVKKIVCDLAREYLPNSFFDNRSKRGFSLPYSDWLKGPLKDILYDTLSEDNIRATGLFDAKTVQNVLREFENGLRPWSHPWILMITELWVREVLKPKQLKF